jgi:hypothetical protein
VLKLLHNSVASSHISAVQPSSSRLVDENLPLLSKQDLIFHPGKPLSHSQDAHHLIWVYSSFLTISTLSTFLTCREVFFTFKLYFRIVTFISYSKYTFFSFASNTRNWIQFHPWQLRHKCRYPRKTLQFETHLLSGENRQL